MKNEENHHELPPGERQHFLSCPHCGELFDMRDLISVLQHQHRDIPVPAITWSHAARVVVPMCFPQVRWKPN